MKIPKTSVLIKIIKHMIENHKKDLVLGALVLISLTFIAVVAAAVYNSMNVQSTVGVG